MLIFQIFWRMYIVFTLFSLAVYPFTFLFQDDPSLIKWKITFYYGLFGLALIISGVFSKKGLIGLIKPSGIDMPIFIWPKVDIYYSVVFLMLAISNAGVALFLTEDVWVNFKLLVPFPAIVIYTLVVSFLVSLKIIRYEQKGA